MCAIKNAISLISLHGHFKLSIISPTILQECNAKTMDYFQNLAPKLPTMQL